MKNTTLRRKEKKLLELMKRATDQCSDGIIITNAKLDDSSKIVYTNKAFCNMTGYNQNELVGKSLYILHGPKTDPRFLAKRRMHLAAGQNFTGKLIKYRKDGSEFYNECDSAPVFSAEGLITNYIYIMRDVSKQVSAQENKEELVSVVSHEFKTPLTAIKGFVEILKNRVNDQNDDKTREYLTIINTEVDRLVGLSNQLLETTKIKTLGVRPDKKLSDLDELVRQEIKNIKVTSNSHKIKRRGKVGELVNCDKDRIRQVITNLLTNAIKYSPGEKEIFVKLRKQNNHVIVSIQDFGKGIPYDKQERIFERYIRETNEHQAVSSGLGLYIAAEIIKNHEGEIWVESNEGNGSIFSFSLPLTKMLDGEMKVVEKSYKRKFDGLVSA